jgi:hypothetical protein
MPQNKCWALAPAYLYFQLFATPQRLKPEWAICGTTEQAAEKLDS